MLRALRSLYRLFQMARSAARHGALAPFEEALAGAGLTPVEEVFADRGYMPDGSLVPRSQPGALIEDEEASLAQTLSLVRDHQVTAIDGSTVAVNAQSVCLHGDGAHALAFAKRIRERLTAEGIAITPLA